MIIAVFIFKNMGGDLSQHWKKVIIQLSLCCHKDLPYLKPTETVMIAERMLMKFPEVKMVSGKTGYRDVATDPLQSHRVLMVILKGKKDGNQISAFTGLSDKMRDKYLSALCQV
ncbi:MAG: hypothetical protein IPM04_13000 [Saprospiraceae bacterium]|nr:hypothetical protein [Candidatus Brachybacter algidus]MBK8748740.1 hypothetical protein [Candidatus Brachybacter algidus]